MAQKITGYIKLQIPAGKATPAPPVGPALGQHGVNRLDYPGCYYRLSGSFLHLCYKNSAGSRSYQESL